MGAKVTADDLERSLARLRAEVRDPRAGIYGPDTIVWEVSREAALFLGAGRAALLQLAHPYVGTAVPEHSITRADPLARFRGTFGRVFRMVFGPLDEAIAEARAVFAIHGRIRGRIPADAGPLARTEYDARDRVSQVWVLATLWDTSLRIFERVVRPLSAAERERYYEESRRFAMLFSVEDDLPPTFSAFRTYVDEMLASDTLTVTGQAGDMGRFILAPEYVFGRLVRRDYRTLTASLLPERLARSFGLGEEDDARMLAERVRAERMLDVAALVVPALPPRLRFIPAYVAALRRIEGRAGRDRIGEYLDALYVGDRR